MLGIAVVGLAVDRGLIFSGGSEAQADLGAPGAAINQAGPATQARPAGNAIPIATQLEAIRETFAVSFDEDRRDAFRMPEVLIRQPVSTVIPEVNVEPPSSPQPVPATTPIPRFELSSVISNSQGRALAVINGMPIRVGETRGGIELLEVSARSATVRYTDQTIVLRLSE